MSKKELNRGNRRKNEYFSSGFIIADLPCHIVTEQSAIRSMINAWARYSRTNRILCLKEVIITICILLSDLFLINNPSPHPVRWWPSMSSFLCSLHLRNLSRYVAVRMMLMDINLFSVFAVLFKGI